MTPFLVAASLSMAPEAHGMNPQWQSLLLKLVDIKSGTLNKPGHDEVRKILTSQLEQMGYQVELVPVADERKVLLARAPGEHEPRVLFMGHVDTVFAESAPHQQAHVKGDRIVGPGTIDMKGGLVLMLNVVAELTPDERRFVQVAINDDEEIGSPYSGGALDEIARHAPYGLVFEPGQDDGALVTSQSGVYWFVVRSKGKAAHAGSHHREGINACVELAAKVTEIAKITDYGKDLTVNVGHIEGGTQPNVVCEEAVARFDLRYARVRDRDDAIAEIRKIVARHDTANSYSGKYATSSFEEGISVPNLPQESTQKLFAMAQAAGASIGQRVTGRHVGYGSDGNHLASVGIELLVGLGPYGHGMHSEDEYMSMSAYDARLRLGVALVRAICRAHE
jgi:glutamate carboxypeptidase